MCSKRLTPQSDSECHTICIVFQTKKACSGITHHAYMSPFLYANNDTRGEISLLFVCSSDMKVGRVSRLHQIIIIIDFKLFVTDYKLFVTDCNFVLPDSNC